MNRQDAKNAKVICPKKISHGNTRKTLKHGTFPERLFTTLQMMAVPA